MKTMMYGALAVFVAGVGCAAMSGDAFAQAGTGPGSGVPGLGGTDSGSAGTSGKKDPHSGTVVTPGQGQSSGGFAEQPAGIGEQGSGQTKSTLERSGGPQSKNSPAVSSDNSKELNEGKTAQAMEEQTRQQSNR